MSPAYVRAWTRRAMIQGDRRDGTVMDNAEWNRQGYGTYPLKPAERCMMELAALATYDRYRERKQLQLATEDTAGRVWP